VEQSEAAVALAMRLGDASALPVAQEAVRVALAAREEAAAETRRQAGIVDRLRSARRWSLPEDGRFGIPTVVQGEVMRRVGDRWVPIGDRPVKKGETIRTGSNSRVDLMFEDGSRIHLRHNSSFTYEGKTLKGIFYKLLKGSMHNMTVPSATRGEIIHHWTPTAVAAVRGTEFDLEVDERGLTHLRLYSGKIELTPIAETMQKNPPARWWEVAGIESRVLTQGYRAAIPPGVQLAATGEGYALAGGRVHIQRTGSDAGAFTVSNASARTDGAFEVSVGAGGLTDFVPLHGTLEVSADAAGLDFAQMKPFWSEQ
jgi:hypothetical protein